MTTPLALDDAAGTSLDSLTGGIVFGVLAIAGFSESELAPGDGPVLFEVDGERFAAFNPAAGRSADSIGHLARGSLLLDAAAGRSSDGPWRRLGRTAARFDDAAGRSFDSFFVEIDLSDNPPAYLGVHLEGQFITIPPPPSGPLSPLVRQAQPIVVLSADAPALHDGRPVAPRFLASVGVDATLKQGPKDIHAITNPDPVWNPTTGGYTTPPPKATAPMAAHWTVSSLPDPGHFANGFYWLGDPTSQDGTANSPAATHQWAPTGGTATTPIWRSFFPYKPSVTAVDHYLQGGGVVHHPKGVNFNSHFIEHMWMNFRVPHRQPFTWIIAAMVASWPTPSYTHNILDAGRNPDSVHFPRLRADQCNVDRPIADGLAYHSMMVVTPSEVRAASHPGANLSGNARCRIDAALRPRMFIGIFNGLSSFVGAYSPGAKRLSAQTHFQTNTSFQHQYYVLGRGQNFIGPSRASHLLVFELRYWDAPLTRADLDKQYAQLSSTYQFDKYTGR